MINSNGSMRIDDPTNNMSSGSGKEATIGVDWGMDDSLPLPGRIWHNVPDLKRFDPIKAKYFTEGPGWFTADVVFVA